MAALGHAVTAGPILRKGASAHIVPIDPCRARHKRRSAKNEMRRTPAVSSSTSQFGQNQWLVDEMYQKYKQDPSSVDESWHEFLADYTPESPGETGNSSPAASAPTAAPSAPATPAPA